MSKRYQGNIISDSPVEPSGSFETSTASGVWSLAEQNTFKGADNWPTAGNAAPFGLFAGGFTSSAVNTIEKIVLTSAGNATDYGDLTTTRYFASNGGAASTTRGVFAGGNNGSDRVNIMDYVDLTTTGNAIDFGDLIAAKEKMAGCSSETRGIFAGGES